MKNIRKRFLTICFAFIVVIVVFMIGDYQKFLVSKKNNSQKRFFNIVLIGAAGSGKGTQSEFIKDRMNLLQISVGEVLRNYRKNPKAKYSKIINEHIDKGLLVPSQITHEVISAYMEEKVFCEECRYDGVIFDGFPRQLEQLRFLDEFLNSHNNKVDTVVHIDVSAEELIERLSGRFSCADCGTLYHKKTKPTKVPGVCDVCGGKHFNVRTDDQDRDAILSRFKIFNDATMPVLEEYKKRGIVIRVDGAKKPKEISEELLAKLQDISKNIKEIKK